MGYQGKFESYKNLTRNNFSNYNSNKLSYWNKLKNNGSDVRYLYKNNKGFFKRLIDVLKYGSLSRRIF